MHDQDEDKIFEAEVRRIAHILWPQDRFPTAVKLNERERDGVFCSDEIYHIVEATTSQKKVKAQYDLAKSVDLVKELRKTDSDRAYKIWFVVSGEPTVDQAGLIDEYRKKGKCLVEICSYRQFSSKIIDSANYLKLRANYPFGSIRDPEDERSYKVSLEEYVPLDLLCHDTKSIVPADSIHELIIENNQATSTIVLLGDYGSGKSMTLRHAFAALQKMHLIGSNTRFPVYLNLRDHFGQDDPAEALMRHGMRIGMSDPNQLIAAWRAGFIYLIMDGFDEVSATRLVRGTRSLVSARRQAMKLVSKFISTSTDGAITITAGRLNYFDSFEEMTRSLGLGNNRSIFYLNESSEEQVQSYLTKKNISGRIPDWLPSRPLLLGYLVKKGILSPTMGIEQKGNQQEIGWDFLLDKVCEREAHQIDNVSIEPSSVREFIERLATYARGTSSGRGPIPIRVVEEQFATVFDADIDEKAEVFLLRLPGLAASAGQEDTREFIDDDFVDACRAGDVARYIAAPHDQRNHHVESVSSEMGELGVRVAGFKVKTRTAKQISAGINKSGVSDGGSYLAFDLVRVLQSRGEDYSGDGVIIRDGFYEIIEIGAGLDFRKLTFRECYFGQIIIEHTGENYGPIFDLCHFGKVIGATSASDLPEGQFIRSEFEEFFDEVHTNADILELPIPTGVKVLMTVLRKLFVQPGCGRRENALFRGLDPAARAYVREILELIVTHGYAVPYRAGGPRVWIPNRSKTREAREILRSPQVVNFPLITDVRRL